ncbi:MAG: FAD-dependent oxidoreductase, partial [Bacteroidota bacterium]
LTKGTQIDVSGLNYQRLKKEGSFQWPVPYEDHPGTPRLFTDRKFFTESGKAKFNIPSRIHNASEATSSEFPLILTTGRIRDQWHTMTRTAKVNKLKNHIDQPFLEIHPDDAQVRNLKEGDLASIRNRRGEVRVRIRTSMNIRRGVVFLPMHWGKILGKDFSRANNLTSDLYDPVSKEPDFKFSSVQVSKYIKPFQKICVIGAGAAAFRFLKSYREENTRDEIHIFSKEAYPFYNRVLLPEYVGNHMEWENLEKISETELLKLQFHLYKNTRIESINPDEKWIQTEKGERFEYDMLISATGSRPFIPRDVPIHLPGVFTMRERSDGDQLKDYLATHTSSHTQQHLLIVGGGLLGLELAAALTKNDLNITIVQRGPRLMERQLDSIASRILAEEVRERGIQIYFDNEVSTIFRNEDDDGLICTLNTGKIISSTACIFAIGTRPNIELLKQAGAKCSRGVEVNELMQSSLEDVYAIGEIAEFKDQLYGITAAAEQQADILARYLSGDKNSLYSGSVLMNILKFEDFDLCSIGKIEVPQNDPSYEEIIFTDLSQRYYKKCIVKDDRLVGAILCGDKEEFAEFRRLIEEKIELSEKRPELLRGASEKEAVEGKLVCSCNHIGEGNLRKRVQGGCHDFKELCQSTGAGLGCGSCKPEVRSILEKELGLVKV